MDGKSTFAKRAPRASRWDKWHAIRDSYNSFVRDKVDYHTHVEDWWGLPCSARQCLKLRYSRIHVTLNSYDSANPLQDYWWHYCNEILNNNGGKLKALKEKVLYDFLCMEHVSNLALKLHVGKNVHFDQFNSQNILG